VNDYESGGHTPPIVEARYDSECDGCGSTIWTGDRIRSDGEGGWLCMDCFTDESETDIYPGKGQA
jgi:hypothetical protein